MNPERWSRALACDQPFCVLEASFVFQSVIAVVETRTSARFFSNDTATTEIYTLSLHDALPIYHRAAPVRRGPAADTVPQGSDRRRARARRPLRRVIRDRTRQTRNDGAREHVFDRFLAGQIGRAHV